MRLKAKKQIAGLLAAAMAFTGLYIQNEKPVEVLAASSSAVVKNVNLNVGNNIAGIEKPTSTDAETATAWTGSKFYYAGMLFRVLDPKTRVYNDNATMFVQTDSIVAEQYYLDSESWLYGSEDGEFLSNFTESEQNIIKESTKLGLEVGESEPINYWTYGVISKEKIFLLDGSEISNKDYGYSNTETRKMAGIYWLRSAKDISIQGTGFYGVVKLEGSYTDYYTINIPLGIVPAMNIDISKIFFSCASYSTLEKDDTFGIVSSDKASSNVWKFTLKSDDTSFAVSNMPTEMKAGGSMTIQVTNSGNEQYTQTSALLADQNGTVVAYGKIGDASVGNKTLTIPSSVANGTYKLYIFNEQINSYKKSDVASNVIESTLVIGDTVSETQIPVNTPTPTPKATATPTATIQSTGTATATKTNAPATESPKTTTRPSTIPTTPSTGAYKSGDVDENGDLDLSDVQLILQYYLDIQPIPNDEVFALADVNHDGSVDLQDVQMVLQAYLGMIELQDTTASKTPTSSAAPTNSRTPQNSVSSESDNEQLFYSYIKNVLVPKYGMAETEQTGTMKSVSDKWLKPEGILSAEIKDLDLDGQDEMLLLRVDSAYDSESKNKIIMGVYEVVDGNVTLAVEKPCAFYDEQYNGTGFKEDVCLEEGIEVLFNVNICRSATPYILFEYKALAQSFADGCRQCYWIVEYNGKDIQDVFSFTGSAGSSDWNYVGYTFENGILNNRELLCSVGDIENNNAKYATNFSKALEESFEKYGISLNLYDISGENVTIGYTNIYSTDFEVLKYRILCTAVDRGDPTKPKYTFNAQANDNTNLRTKLSSIEDTTTSTAQPTASETPSTDDSWKETYKEFLTTYKNSSQYENAKFKLIYIDEDDVPEILIMLGTAYASGGDVYTFYNNKVTKVNGEFSYGSTGSVAYAKKDNLIKSDTTHKGYTHIKFCSIKNGKEVVLGNFFDDRGVVTDETITYKYNDVSVPKQEYDTAYNSIIAGKEFIEVSYDECLEITVSNINSALK